jgi:hypothetical protein
MLSPLFRYSMKELSPDKGIDAVLQRYDLLGPIARLCLELDPNQVEDYISERDTAIASAGPKIFRDYFSESTLIQAPFDSVSHKIFLLQRKRGSPLGEGYTIELISAAVEQIIVQRLEDFSNGQLLDMWKNFSRLDDSRGMASSIFGSFIHRHFRSRIVLDATPMVRLNCANSGWHASFSTKRPDATTIHRVVQQNFSLDIDVDSVFVYDTTTTTLHIQQGIYYVPRSGQQVTLGSFILHGGYLNIFQCTADHNHNIKDDLVRFLTSCSGLPHHTSWRFVFIVPDELDLFYCPASNNSIVKEMGFHTARISMSGMTVES